MSLARKGSKGSLRPSPEDLNAVLDQKNTIISSLQGQIQALRINQQLYDRARDELSKAKSRYQTLVREQDTLKTSNQQRLDISQKHLQQLKIQADHVKEELAIRTKCFQQSRFTSQQLVEYQNKKQDQTTQAKNKHVQLKGINQSKRAEEQRTRLCISQMREEVERGKRQSSMIRAQVQSLSDKCHKTQTYIRGLLRQESSLNENLLRIEEQNNKLDSQLDEVDQRLARGKDQIQKSHRNIQDLQFQIANLELSKKKIQNQSKQKTKLLLCQKERLRQLSDQHDAKKIQMGRLQAQLQETGDEINYIISKNTEISEVNQQLTDDLKVCQRHQENVLRVNKQLEGQIQQFMQLSLRAIAKLKQPFTNRTNTTSQLNEKWAVSGQKWTSGRSTGFQTGFQRRTVSD